MFWKKVDYFMNKNTIILVAPVLFLLLILPGYSLADSIKTILTNTQAASDKGEFKEAQIILKNGIQEYPDNARLRVALAINFLAIGKGERAQQTLNKAISLGVDPVSVQIPLTRAKLMQGKAGQIVRDLNKIIGVSRTDLASLRAIQGRAFLHKNKKQRAYKLFLRAYKMAPNELEVKISLAIMYSIQGDIDKLRVLVEPLYQQYPYNVDILILAGNLFIFDNKPEQAIDVFTTIKKIQANNLTAWQGHINALISQQDYIQASDLIVHLIELFPEYEEGYRLQSKLAFYLKDYRKAHQAIVKLEDFNPDNKEVLLLSGAIYFHLGQYDKAQRKLKSFLENNPGDLNATRILAEIELNNNQPEQALEYLLAFKNEDDAALKILLAAAYNQLGYFEKGLFFLTQASELQSNNQQIEQRLNFSKLLSGLDVNLVEQSSSSDFTEKELVSVVYYIKSGQFNKALEVLEKYEINSHDKPIIEYFFGVVYLQKNELDKAEVYFNNAHQLNDKFISPLSELAALYMKKGETGKARRKYRKILALDVNNLDSLLGMGTLSMMEQNEKKMLHWFNRARDQNPYAIKPRLLLNRYYYSRGQFNEALSISEELFETYSERADLIELHILNLLALRDYPLAIRYLKKLIKLPQPDLPTIWQRLAIAQFMIEDHDKSKLNFEKILELDPDNLVAKSFLLKLAIKNEDYEDAMNMAKALSVANPEKGIGEEALGDIWWAQNNYGKAIEHYNKSIDVHENASVVIKVFNAYLRQNSTEKAVAVMELWLKNHLNDIRMRTILAYYYQRSEQFQFAKSHYEIIVEQQPSDVSAINNLALMYDQLDDLRSIDFAELAYSLAPESPAINDTLGWVLVKNGDSERAVELLKYASKNAPADSDIMYHYAVALVKTGDKNKALRILYRFVPLNGSYESKNEAELLLKKLEDEKN